MTVKFPVAELRALDEALALAEHAANKFEEAMQAVYGADYRVPQEIDYNTFAIAYQVLSDLARNYEVEI